MKKGKLIVFEGVDGTGKETQVNLFKRRLSEEGLSYKFNTFPRYNKSSSYFINRYLDDLESPYGNSEDISPRMASLFYSLDRADASFGIKRWLENYDVVVLDRFTGSNIGHQGGKLKNDDERKEYVDWLFDLEYEILQIPKPDLNIVLDNPMNVIKKRLTARASTDAHESNFDHIESAKNAYLWAADNYENFVVIDGVEGETEMTPEEIHERVWSEFKSKIKL